MIMEIYKSFRALPGWVQIWVMFLLMPINMASIFFINEPMGLWIAVLAIGAMMLNMPVMLYDRGFSKLMALPHIIPWTLLVAILVFRRPEASGTYDIYLWVLLVAELISLGFDYPDAISWINGKRDVSGRARTAACTVVKCHAGAASARWHFRFEFVVILV